MVNRINHNSFKNQRNSDIFSTVFKSYFDSLYNYGYRITKDEDLVKDSIQELFFRIWKNKVELSDISNLKSYLLKGLRNQIINIFELKNNKVKKVEIEENFSIEFSPEDYYIKNQIEISTRKKVIDALNELSQKQREAIYLRFFEELDFNEIAEIMSITIQSVKNNIQRGYVPLKLKLQ